MRAWLDNVEETTGHYAQFRAPTKVERFVGDYFEFWLEAAKHDQDMRRQSARSATFEDQTFHGFGVHSEETWDQWIDFVLQLDTPDSDDGKEPV